MTPTYRRWYIDEEPVFGLLPGVNGGYSENEVARWLCGPWDQLKLGSRDVIDDLPRQLDPLECDAEWLDYLAGLCGFTGP